MADKPNFSDQLLNTGFAVYSMCAECAASNLGAVPATISSAMNAQNLRKESAVPRRRGSRAHESGLEED